jgi:hypothetical protein
MKTDGARRLLDGLARRDGFESFAAVERALENDRPAPDVCENCGHRIGGILCNCPPTAPPEEALEDAKVFLRKKFGVASEGFHPDVMAQFAVEYAAKKLAERDKQTINEHESPASRVKELEAALREYANPANWAQNHDGTDDYCVWAQHGDGYDLARTALGEKNG